LHHEQDIFKIAQKGVDLPVVYKTMFLATLAITAIPPFAGFFSKDAIIDEALFSGAFPIYLIALFSAFLTSFYMFRMFFILFVAPTNRPRSEMSQPRVIALPLIVLAIGATLLGFLNFPSLYGGEMMFSHWLGFESKPHEINHFIELIVVVFHTSVAIAGIYLAYGKYAQYDVSKPEIPSGIGSKKFMFDEVYFRAVVYPVRKVSRFISEVIDQKIIDRVVMGISYGFIDISKRVSLMQNANTRFYAMFMLAGLSVLFIYLFDKVG
jgi:NADH-quinone oxidoreductase subunit L